MWNGPAEKYSSLSITLLDAKTSDVESCKYCLLVSWCLPYGYGAQEATVKKRCMTRQRVAVLSPSNMPQVDTTTAHSSMTPTSHHLYQTRSDRIKKHRQAYDWAENARKDEVKVSVELAFPLWRGILGPNSVLRSSYAKSRGNCPIAKSLHRFREN